MYLCHSLAFTARQNAAIAGNCCNARRHMQQATCLGKAWPMSLCSTLSTRALKSGAVLQVHLIACMCGTHSPG